MSDSIRFFATCACFIALLLGQPAGAQITAAPGYTIKIVDGKNELTEFFAVTRAFAGDQLKAFYYLADKQALYYGECSGSTCNLRTQLTTTGDRGKYVSVANIPSAPGAPLIAYYDATNADLRVASCFTSSCLGLAGDRLLDGGGDVGGYTSMAVSPVTGFAVISYYSATFGDARLYACADAGCTTGSVSNIETTSDVGRNSALAFGANLANFTNLFAVYDDATLGEVRFARGIAPYSSFGAISLGSGTDPAINVGSSGFADIVYRGPSDNLTYVRCTALDCTSLNRVSQVLAGSGKGFSPSITRLPNGNVFITASEPATGSQFGYVCNDAVCASPQVLTLGGAATTASASIASNYADGRPLAFYLDSANKQIRSGECTVPTCTGVTSRVALNGFSPTLPNLAVRPDGRVVTAWIRDRTPYIGICSDMSCSTVTERNTGGGNTDVRPAIVVRPDGRPFVYYTSFGGTGAWDCNDTECATGTARTVSGLGNSTSNTAELVLRADGRPVMAYYNDSSKQVFVFTCDDINCASGSAHLVATEPTAGISFFSGLSLTLAAGERAVVTYVRAASPDGGLSFTSERRFARCADSNCSSASVSTLATAPAIFSANNYSAAQSNRNVSFGEGATKLISCSSNDCATFSTTTLPFGAAESPNTMRFKPGNIPLFDANAGGQPAGYVDCLDAACISSNRVAMIVSTPPSAASFAGRLALRANGDAVSVVAEANQQDVWLALPVSATIFANGFE
jgi:hypothetical protein